MELARLTGKRLPRAHPVWVALPVPAKSAPSCDDDPQEDHYRGNAERPGWPLAKKKKCEDEAGERLHELDRAHAPKPALSQRPVPADVAHDGDDPGKTSHGRPGQRARRRP